MKTILMLLSVILLLSSCKHQNNLMVNKFRPVKHYHPPIKRNIPNIHF